MTTERSAEVREYVAVNAPVACDAPREDKEDRESEENRIDAYCAREHEVQIH